MSLEHAKKHAKAYDHVVTVAKELAAFARCRCHECWTGRGRHDPHGCLWADIEDLRLAVEALDSVSKEQNEEPDLVSAVPSETSCGNGCDLAEPQQLCGPPHRENVPEDSGGVSPDPTRTAPLGANVMNRSSRPQAGEHRSSETHPCLDCGRPTSYFAQKMQGGHWLCRDGEGCNVPRTSEAKSEDEDWKEVMAMTPEQLDAELRSMGADPIAVGDMGLVAAYLGKASRFGWPGSQQAKELQALLASVREDERKRQRSNEAIACGKGHHLSPTLRCTLATEHDGVCMYSIEAVLAACAPPAPRADKAKVEESKPNPEVYSRPECIWNYCCDPEGCIARNACQNPSRSAPRAETPKEKP